jgi:hypothetical protein
MSITFPSSPTTGQTAAVNGRTYSWNGSAWDLVANVNEHAASHASGGADAITISAGQVSGLAAVATSGSAAALSAGTLSDARLSTNVLNTTMFAGWRNHPITAYDSIERNDCSSGFAATSTTQFWTFFTPAYSLTVTQMTMQQGNAASGITNARMGLYTMDNAGNGTLVARTAADPTLFSAANTSYTRVFDGTGGFPTSYTLVAGQRYAASFFITASAVGTTVGASVQQFLGTQTPRTIGSRNGVSDLVATQGSSQYIGNTSLAYWQRFS